MAVVMSERFQFDSRPDIKVMYNFASLLFSVEFPPNYVSACMMFSFRILINIVKMNVFSCTHQVKGEQKPEMAFYRAVFFPI